MRSDGFGWAVVLGEPQCYGRFGFRDARSPGLSDEYGGGPAFQILELSPGCLPYQGGSVRYSPAFLSLGECVLATPCYFAFERSARARLGGAGARNGTRKTASGPITKT
jgi:hypothetical protein